jgi:CRISPR-associated protein Cmr6
VLAHGHHCRRWRPGWVPACNQSTGWGEIIFLGGFPVKPPKLVLDILTPHEHGAPRPNPFLALDPGTRWIFAFLARPRHGDAKELLRQTTDWLCEALTQVGLGAKTAAGYGRFRSLTADGQAESFPLFH